MLHEACRPLWELGIVTADSHQVHVYGVGHFLGDFYLKAFHLQDVVRYITVGHIFVNTQAVGANANSWAKISAGDQKIIEDISSSRMAKVTGANFDNEGKAGFETAVGGGVELINLSAAELANWRQAVSGIHAQWVGDMAAKGLPGQKVFDEAVKLAEKYK